MGAMRPHSTRSVFFAFSLVAGTVFFVANLGTVPLSSLSYTREDRRAFDFDTEFQEAEAQAQKYLTAAGRALVGKVYVYAEWPFNWLPTLSKRGCLDLEKYCAHSLGYDCAFARQMLSDDAPWRTFDPAEASLFVIPALFGTGIMEVKTASALERGITDASRCSFRKAMAALKKALRSARYWKQRRPHLLMSGGWNTPKLLLSWLGKKPHLIIGSFETGFVKSRPKFRPKVYAYVHTPYLSSCRDSRANLAAWANLAAERGILYHFRGRISYQSSYSLRKAVCDAMLANATFDNDPSASTVRKICASSSPLSGEGVRRRHSSVYAERCPDGCAVETSDARCRKVLACSQPSAEIEYCDEVKHARFLLVVRGDTPSTSRLYDAIDNGALPLVVPPPPGQLHLIEVSGDTGLVQWKDFLVDLPLDKAALSEAMLGRTACELEGVRRRMFRWTPMLSWSLSPRTTSMYVLAQAARTIESRGWLSDSGGPLVALPALPELAAPVGCQHAAAPSAASEAATKPRCANGPYILDLGSDLGSGIGSQFQVRRISLVYANALDVPWFGLLPNGHDRQPKDVEKGGYAAFFGLGSSDCSLAELKAQYYAQAGVRPSDHYFVSFTGKEILPHFVQLAALVERHGPTNAMPQSWAGALPEDPVLTAVAARKAVEEVSGLVVVFKPKSVGPAIKNWNYATFTRRFRQRYEAMRASRGIVTRPPSEVWIGVHFRWGDVATGSVEHPNGRAGASLTTLAKITASVERAVAASSGETAVRVFLFAEGEAATFSAFTDLVPSAILQSGSSSGSSSILTSSQLALEHLSQAQVVIGGDSSFFMLGAHLCKRCVVVCGREDRHNKHRRFPPPKFQSNVADAHAGETSHHRLINSADFRMEDFASAFDELFGRIIL